MKEILRLPRELDGWVWRYSFVSDALRLHHHDELELNLVIAGEASYLVNDRRYDLRRHTLIWLFPGQEHVLLDQSRDYQMWIAVFKPPLLRRACRIPANRTLLKSDPPGQFSRQIPERPARRLEALFADLVAAKSDPPRYNAGIAYALLGAWAVHQSGEVTAALDLHPAVERAARLIRERNGEAMPLAELAEEAGLSASRLSRLFKRQTGVSLVRYRQRSQLEQFLRLYQRNADTNLMQAALQAGFGSYPQFHRVFTSLMGCSPREYRRREI